MKFCHVCTSLSDHDKAAQMARESINRKLAFCCWIRPKHVAIYEWDGALCEESEFELILKTKPDNIERLTSLILDMHPYKVPYIACFQGDILHNDYARWADAFLSQGG